MVARVGLVSKSPGLLRNTNIPSLEGDKLSSVYYKYYRGGGTEKGLLQWLSGQESACTTGAAGHVGSVPGLRRFPGGGHGIPFKYSCLENPMDRGTWQAIDHGVSKSWT